VANGDSNKTLWVAVAGIAATALVGLAGTTAAWLSARDDRAAQRQLARDERRYDRRVATYLDAIDFLERQRIGVRNTLGQVYHYVKGPIPALPKIAGSRKKRRTVPYPEEPPARLMSRLRAFGSKEVVSAFEQTQNQSYLLPLCVDRSRIDVRCSFAASKGVGAFLSAYESFAGQVVSFEKIVHEEVG
jgi:hypothetical protein